MPKEKSKKVGRPSLGKDAKSVVLQSRVQADEKKLYRRVAMAQGKDLSTWIRDTLNAATK